MTKVTNGDQKSHLHLRAIDDLRWPWRAIMHSVSKYMRLSELTVTAKIWMKIDLLRTCNGAEYQVKIFLSMPIYAFHGAILGVFLLVVMLCIVI